MEPILSPTQTFVQQVKTQRPLLPKQLSVAVLLLTNQIWSAKDRQFLCDQLDKSRLPEEVQKIYQTVLVQNADLFPCVTVEVEDEQIQVPKSKLLMISEKFRRELQGGMIEGQKNYIRLETQNVNPNEFLNYLATGHITLTGDNALPLLYEADKQELTELVKSCTHFLIKNLNKESLKFVLTAAVDIHSEPLFWGCFAFKDTAITGDSFTVPYDLKIKARKLFDYLLREIEESKVSPSKYGVLGCCITEGVNPEMLQSLHQRIGFSAISLVCLTKSDYEKIDTIIPLFPELHILEDSGDVKNCIPTLRTQAEILHLNGCGDLFDLVAPRAKSVKIVKAYWLEIVDAPSAQKLEVNGCPKLKKVTVKKGCEVTISKESSPKITFV